MSTSKDTGTSLASFLPSLRIQTGLLLFIIAVLLSLVGCRSGGAVSSVDPGRIADQHLPRDRTTEAHPDVVRHLSIVEEDNRIAFELNRSYQEMHRIWSSTFEVLSTRRGPQRPLTYATLWSQELSLAALNAQENLATLPKALARERIADERRSYQETIQIDVFWFTRVNQSPLALRTSDVQLRLQDGDSDTLRPIRVDHGLPRDVFLTNGERVLYRRNILVFERMVDGRDVLAGVNELQLRVITQGGGRIQFAWSWPAE